MVSLVRSSLDWLALLEALSRWLSIEVVCRLFKGYLITMRCLLTFLTCVMVIGAVSEVVECKDGHEFTLYVSFSFENIYRLTVKRNGTKIFGYCSSEEKVNGCSHDETPVKSYKEGVIATFRDASNCKEHFSVEVTDETGTVSQPMFQLIDSATKNTADPVTGDNKEAIIGGSICILGVIVCVIIYWKWKEIKQYCNNREERDEDCEQGKPLRSDVNGDTRDQNS